MDLSSCEICISSTPPLGPRPTLMKYGYRHQMGADPLPQAGAGVCTGRTLYLTALDLNLQGPLVLKISLSQCVNPPPWLGRSSHPPWDRQCFRRPPHGEERCWSRPSNGRGVAWPIEDCPVSAFSHSYPHRAAGAYL